MAPKKTKTPKKEAAKEETPKKEEVEDVEMADAPKTESPKKEAPGSPKKEGEEPKAEEPVKEEKKEPEKPKKVFDVEWSAEVAKDTRKKMAWTTEISKEDTSLTLLVADGCLSCATRDGLGNLYSGGRATTGIKAGRYMFEVRMLDAGMLRFGFGTAEANLVGGSCAGSVAADEANRVWSENKFASTKAGMRAAANDVFAAVLNLDATSEQKNTISFFRNGLRTTEPFPLPEALHGKTLFPMVALKQATAAVHFGGPDAQPLRELPFQARTLDDAAAADVVQSAVVPLAAGAKREVVFPVGLPDEGTGDFLDFGFFPNAKKKHIEVSERGLQKLLLQSGHRGQVGNAPTFRVEELTNGRMLSAYIALASARKRDYVVVKSVRGALVRKEREEAVNQFNAPWFTKKAVIAVGAPPAAFVKLVRADQLEQQKLVKQNQVSVEKAKWTSEQNGKKIRAEAVAKAATAKAKAEFAKATKEFEAKKAAFEAAKEKAEEGKELPEEPTEPTEPAEVAPEFELEEEPDWDKKAEVDASTVTCTFRPRPANNSNGGVAPMKAGEVPHDIESNTLARLFEQFELPTEGAAIRTDSRWLLQDAEPPAKKGEGFDVVEYVWAKKAGAEKYIADQKSARKISDKWAGLAIGPYHKEQLEAWSTAKFDLRKKHADFLERMKKIKVAKAAKAAGEEAPKSPKSPKAEEAPKSPKKEGEAEKDAEMEKVEEKEEELDLDFEPQDADLDVKDVLDTDGHGTPMFKDFGTEDWILAQTRFEVHHLLKCFAEDATKKDAERRGISTELFQHYYSLYFSKVFTPQTVGQKDLETFLEYFSDMVEVKNGVLVCKAEDDVPLDHLIRATEEARRDRINRIAAGDESAKLTFSTPKPTVHISPAAAAKGYGGKGQQQPKGYGKAAYPAAVAAGKGYRQPAYQPYGKGYHQQPAYGQQQAYGQGGYKRPAYQQQPTAKRPAYGR